MAIKRIGKINIVYRKGTSDENVISESFEQNIFLFNVYEYIGKVSMLLVK